MKVSEEYSAGREKIENVYDVSSVWSATVQPVVGLVSVEKHPISLVIWGVLPTRPTQIARTPLG